MVGERTQGEAAASPISGDPEEAAASGRPASPPPPCPIFVANTVHGTTGYFSSGWPVAYLVATVIFGIGLLVGAFTYVSRHEQVADNSPPIAAERRLESQPKMEFVGRITGMVDCQWEEGARGEGRGTGDGNLQSLIPNPQSLVSLGDKFALASGLMEITYDTGAKVILQGPVTYEVESAAGGYLSLGKLTARVEKKSGRAREGESEIRNPKSLIPLSLIPHPFFSVRTPTATVTDLGTEFGVEVDKQGHTTSHVFRGSVRLQLLGAERGRKATPSCCTRTKRCERRRATPAALASPCAASARSADLRAAGCAKRPRRSICWTSWPAATERRSAASAASIRPPAWKTRRSCREYRPGDGKYHAVDLAQADRRRVRSRRRGRPGGARFGRAHLRRFSAHRWHDVGLDLGAGGGGQAGEPRKGPPTIGCTAWAGASSTCPRVAACSACTPTRESRSIWRPCEKVSGGAAGPLPRRRRRGRQLQPAAGRHSRSLGLRRRPLARAAD